MLEMNRMRISCLGLCEVRWTGNEQFEKDDKTIIYLGGCGHNNGVALLMDKTFTKSILSYLPKADRLLLVKLKANPFNINLIVAYAPAAEADESVLEMFNKNLDDLYKNCKSQEINILLGDFNAKVGLRKQGKTVGPHRLGTHNERGERLVDWCEEKKLVITNTWFETHPRQKYIWIGPGDRARNQIDYIMINERYRTYISNARPYPGADANSDHNPVSANIKIYLKVKKMLKTETNILTGCST